MLVTSSKIGKRQKFYFTDSWYEHFKDLFSKSDIDPPEHVNSLHVHDDECIPCSHDERNVLNFMITEDEINWAINDMKRSKAPGPDGTRKVGRQTTVCVSPTWMHL